MLYQYSGDLKELFNDLKVLLKVGQIEHQVHGNSIFCHGWTYTLADENQEGIILPEVAVPEDMVIRIFDQGLELKSAVRYLIKNKFDSFKSYDPITISSYQFILYHLVSSGIVKELVNNLNLDLDLDIIDFTNLVREVKLKILF